MSASSALVDAARRVVQCARSAPRGVPPSLLVEVARLDAAIATQPEPGPLVLDADRSAVVGPAGAVRLSPQQFRVLNVLAERAGHKVPHALLKSMVYDGVAAGSPDNPRGTLRVQMCRVRRALRQSGSPATISRVWGDGYRLDVEAEQPSDRK